VPRVAIENVAMNSITNVDAANTPAAADQLISELKI